MLAHIVGWITLFAVLANTAFWTTILVRTALHPYSWQRKPRVPKMKDVYKLDTENYMGYRI